MLQRHLPKTVALIIAVLLWAAGTMAQQTYYPDASWQTNTAQQAGVNKQRLDSAIAFAMANENKVEKDLRLANIKAYSREPGYAIIGPHERTGRPCRTGD